MPQLSPINWIFLYTVFWLMILLTMCLVWWVTCVKFVFTKSEGSKGSGVGESVWGDSLLGKGIMLNVGKDSSN